MRAVSIISSSWLIEFRPGPVRDLRAVFLARATGPARIRHFLNAISRDRQFFGRGMGTGKPAIVSRNFLYRYVRLFPFRLVPTRSASIFLSFFFVGLRVFDRKYFARRVSPMFDIRRAITAGSRVPRSKITKNSEINYRRRINGGKRESWRAQRATRGLSSSFFGPSAR